MIEIPLSKNGKYAGKYVAIIDDCDADLAKLRWDALVITENLVYAKSQKKGKTVYMHRIIIERKLGHTPTKGNHTDHVNNNGLDNRRENLRSVTRQQNAINRRKKRNSSSKYKGVSWCNTSNKWQVHCTIDGKSVFFGSFDDEEAAAEIAKTKLIEIYGDFANYKTSEE